jgi:spore coat protein U-like protein
MDFCEQMFTKASQNSDISASCSENIVTVAFYVNVKSCRYFINRLALSSLSCILTYNFYEITNVWSLHLACLIKFW